MAGAALLVHEALDRMGLLVRLGYVAGQCRAQCGLRTADKDMCNGAPARYEWKLLGFSQPLPESNRFSLATLCRVGAR